MLKGLNVLNVTCLLKVEAMKTVLILLSLSFIKVESSSLCDCESALKSSRYQSCFSSRDPNLTPKLNALRDLVVTLTTLRSTSEVRGTLFLVDSSTTDHDLYLLQTQIAGLVALTLPVSNECNPGIVVQYSGEATPRYGRGHCMDECDSSRFLYSSLSWTEPEISTPDSNYDNIGRGCFIGQTLLNKVECKDYVDMDNLMAIAFANSDNQIVDPVSDCNTFKERVLIKFHSGASSGVFVNVPENEIDFNTYTLEELRQPIKYLMECVEQTCQACEMSVKNRNLL